MKCSVLGHDYGDEEAQTATTESDDGNIEVSRSVETCTRCGHQNTISENKHVRPSDGTPSTETQDPSRAARTELADTADDALILSDSAEPSESVASPPTDETAEHEPEPEQTAPDANETTSSVAPVSGDEGVAFLDSSTSTPSDTDADTDSTETPEQPAPAAEEATPQEPSQPLTAGDHAEFVGTPTVNTTSTSSSASSAEASPTPDESDRAASTESATPQSKSTTGYESGRDDALVKYSQSARERMAAAEADDENERQLVCPSCSYRATQSNECRWAGDSCPECRGAFLNWDE